jgi:AcrR family transcriptional regulator
MKRSFERRTPVRKARQVRARPHAPARARGSPPAATARDAILQAALTVLGREGFASLTARNIAREAGTNLALLNYYFGSKDGLLLALFDVLDADRLARQRAMYAEPAETLSEKWRRAVEFYRADLREGYVRVLQELTAQAYSNERVRARLHQHTSAWRDVLRDAARTYLPALGVDLDPEIVANAVGTYWLGMETQHLVRIAEKEGTFFATLELIGEWIERQERRGGKRSART